MLRLAYLAVAIAVGVAPIEAALQCKCLPGQSCFPSAAVISAFEQNLTHPLLNPRPIANVCFRSDPAFNEAACNTVKANWNNGAFRASNPNTLQFINWESIINSTVIEQCDPFGNVNSPADFCFQGRVPFAVVNATTVSDIQNTVLFASEFNLKLVVKNTGYEHLFSFLFVLFMSTYMFLYSRHESLGRSFGESSIEIWTHNMQDVEFSDSFVPQGAPNGTAGIPSTTFLYYVRIVYLFAVTSAVTIGPGVNWGDLYNIVDTQGKVVVGGIGAGGTVGAAGGWPMGGGHGILSPFFGLGKSHFRRNLYTIFNIHVGVDNIVEETVVLPNGTHVTANLYTNSDLFWALRGGGGPSFGILTSVTYKTHPAEPVTAAFLVANTTTDEGRLALFTEWVQVHPAVVDAGWAGFWPYSGTQFFLTLMALGDPPTNPAANATLQGFYDTISQIPGVEITLEVTKAYTGFHQWYEDNFINSTNGIGFNYTVGDFSGVPVAVASRLIPRENFENNTVALAQALTALDDARPLYVQSYSP